MRLLTAIALAGLATLAIATPAQAGYGSGVSPCSRCR